MNRPVELKVMSRRSQDREDELSELDNPNAGNPDAQPGNDRPDQRPITDNKAGG